MLSYNLGIIKLIMTKISAFHIEPRLTRLLVIDAQNDVCDSNSAYANSEMLQVKSVE